MTMKPKASKFRIRHSSDTARTDQTPEDILKSEATKPVRPKPKENTETVKPRATSKKAPPSNQQDTAGQSIDDIRKEGLTGRQLRMARRLAQKHDMAPISDFDAVRLLRAKGIDPFQANTVIELINLDKDNIQKSDLEQASATKVQLPQTMPVQQMLPSAQVSPAERRTQEIMGIQRDIGRRRRRKLLLLMSRLSAFVLLPTLIAGYYYYAVATPMYSTKSAFQILSADGAGSSPAGGLLQGTAFATGPDSISVQDYLQSKAAMLRLEEDEGFRSLFTQDWIDPIQRLDPDSSTEKAYKIYMKYVKLGYDPTEGVIRMEVSSPDPAASVAFSEKLIKYAEENVDQQSKRKRQDTLTVSQESLEQAMVDRRAAQQRLVELQENSILDPLGEISNIRTLINSVEIQLQEKQLALSIQLNNTRPSQAKVEALRSEIEILTTELSKQNARLTQAQGGGSSLAAQAAAIQMAEGEILMADVSLQSALETNRQSAIEANKQVRYLTVSVIPVISEDPSYPRSFENTVLAFLILSGVYLMISLTASVLKEQVSS